MLEQSVGYFAAAMVLLALPACRTTEAAGPPAGDVARVRATLDDLYDAFCFDAGQGADWDGMRMMFAEGAAFVAPGSTAAVGTEEFLLDFRAYTNTASEGLHERIEHARIEVYGQIAHAWVAFDGFEPVSGELRSRGLDSIQFVRDGEDWLVASFTTQYGGPGESLPERFR